MDLDMFLQIKKEWYSENMMCEFLGTLLSSESTKNPALSQRDKNSIYLSEVWICGQRTCNLSNSKLCRGTLRHTKQMILSYLHVLRPSSICCFSLSNYIARGRFLLVVMLPDCSTPRVYFPQWMCFRKKLFGCYIFVNVVRSISSRHGSFFK